MKKEVIIQNRNISITLFFSDEEKRQEMKKAINNCLENEKEYPTINYTDSKENLIFPATFLKNSLIKFPL